MSNHFVFDTNSLISAHLLPSSVNRLALDRAISIGTVVYSKESLTEWKETFSRVKFDKYISIEDRLEAVFRFEKAAQLVEVRTIISVCRDPKDNKFLSLAIDGNASIIITGDKDLLVLNPFKNITIISASEFLPLSF